MSSTPGPTVDPVPSEGWCYRRASCLIEEGLLFGADRNITSQLTMRDGSVEIVVTGQSERPKVLKWPNHEVIVGYVGAAQIARHPTDQWLYGFIGRNLDSLS